jgi:acetoin utilization protein AcuB
MLVKHLMTPDPIAIAPDQSVAEAGTLMTEKGVRHLPVMEGDRLVGLVTRTSLAQALPGLGTGLTRFEHNYLTVNTKIREVMIRDPVLGTEDMAAEEAARVMNARRISSLVVVRDGVPVGIITDTNIFEAMLELLGARRKGVRLTVHLEARTGQLSRVSGAIAQAGGNISSVGAWQVDSGTWGVVMKVENMPAERTVEALRDVPGLTLVDVRA